MEEKEYVKTGKCIWCGQEKPMVKFRNKPHIIPHALESPLIGVDVCDDCNSFFGNSLHLLPSIDLAFKEVFNAFRFFNQQLDKNSHKKFKSVYFSYRHSDRKVTVKPSFNPEIITKQFKKGLYEVFLQYYHSITHDANNPLFDHIRNYVRFNIGQLRVFYLKIEYVLKPIEDGQRFLLPMTKTAIDEIFKYGIYRFHFFGHFFYLEVIPMLFNAHYHSYFSNQVDLMVLPNITVNGIYELTNVLDTDFFMQRFYNRNIIIR